MESSASTSTTLMKAGTYVRTIMASNTTMAVRPRQNTVNAIGGWRQIPITLYWLYRSLNNDTSISILHTYSHSNRNRYKDNESLHPAYFPLLLGFIAGPTWLTKYRIKLWRP